MWGFVKEKVESKGICDINKGRIVVKKEIGMKKDVSGQSA